MLMTLPLFLGTMQRRPTSCVSTKSAVTLSVITLFQPSSGCSTVDAPHDVPALLTRMSIGPSFSITVSTSGRIACSSLMSQTSGSTSTPWDFRCAAASSSSFFLRAVIATFAPSSPRTSAICRPSPREPPVTRATLPWRSSSLARLMTFSPGSWAVAAHRVVARHPLVGEDRARQRRVAREHHRGADLGELVRLALAVAVHHLETLALCREAGAAAVGGDDQRGQRDRPVVVAVVEQLRVGDAGVRLGDVGDVLPGRDEHRRQAVRGVRAVVRRAG